jgi:hypothetical protein
MHTENVLVMMYHVASAALQVSYSRCKRNIRFAWLAPSLAEIADVWSAPRHSATKLKYTSSILTCRSFS